MQKSLNGDHTTVDPTVPPQFLTIAETAERWRVCRQTVSNALARGELRSIHIGKRILIPSTEILRVEQSFSA